MRTIKYSYPIDGRFGFLSEDSLVILSINNKYIYIYIYIYLYIVSKTNHDLSLDLFLSNLSTPNLLHQLISLICVCF